MSTGSSSPNICTTMEQAQKELAAAEQDFLSDHPDGDLDEVYSDLVDSVAWGCTPEVAAEVRRMFRGW